MHRYRQRNNLGRCAFGNESEWKADQAIVTDQSTWSYNFDRTPGRLLFAEHRRTLEAAIATVAHELATPVHNTRISRGVAQSTTAVERAAIYAIMGPRARRGFGPLNKPADRIFAD